MAFRCLSIILLCLSSAGTFAEAVDVKDMSLEELESLSPEQLNDLPAKELFAKSEFEADGASVMFEMLVRTVLHTKMYGFDRSVPLEGLIKDFQKDNGYPATGTLTFGEFQQLTKGNILNQATPVYTSGYAKPYIFEDHASVEGTWVIETDEVGEQHAFPVNTSRIECYRSWSVCIEFTALLKTHDFGDNVRNLSDTYYMSTSVEHWDILDWSANEVVMKEDGECRTVTITLNSKSGEVYEITRNAGGSCEVLGVNLPKLEAPQVSVLKPGFDVSRAYFEEMNDAARKGLSSKFFSAYKDLVELSEQAESQPTEQFLDAALATAATCSSQSAD